ncbi:MAG: hypothetical protein Q8Q18_03040 [bacterium]|nr:hypothetical protein [bacterium]
MNSHNHKGASIVELVLYIGVFSLLMGVLFSITLSLYGTFNSVRATRSSIIAANTGLERIVREVRNANSVLPSSILAVSPSTLTVSRDDGSEISFSVIGGVLFLSVDGAQANPLTSSDVFVQSFIAQKYETTYGEAVSIYLEFTDPRGTEGIRRFTSTIVLRGSYD